MMRGVNGKRKGEVSVSVIIPCYCCDDTIERAVNSVMAQTVLPKELLLIDDASPDQGRTVSKLYALKQRYCSDVYIEVITLQSNKGPAVARNTGWDLAKQDYIAFLDSDDSWHSEKLEIQYAWMEKHSGVSLTGHRCILWKDEVKQERVPTNWSVSSIGKRSALLHNPFSTPSVMLRRDLHFRFERGLYYAEDYYLWLNIVSSGHLISRIELPLAYLHKAHYGELGLSSHMWAMEKAELANYRRLCQRGYINQLYAMLLCMYSFAKYCRRMLIVSAKRSRLFSL